MDDKIINKVARSVEIRVKFVTRRFIQLYYLSWQMIFTWNVVPKLMIYLV